MKTYRPHLGGNWNNGTQCGSRCSNWNNSPLNLNSNNSSRGVADTQGRILSKLLGLTLWLVFVSWLHPQPNTKQGGGGVSSLGGSPASCSA